MKFVHKKSKIEKLISKDPTQRILENPWLDVDRGIVMASSGQNALIIPVEVEPGDVSGPVPIEALKAVRGVVGASLQCGADYCVVPSGAAHPRGQFTQYPPVDQLLVQEGPTVEVSFNAKLLAELAGAMGTEVVKLRIPVQHFGGGKDAEGSDIPVRTEALPASPLVVIPHPSEPHVDGSMGALLPYRVARV